jgi:hypothetical protein
VELYGLFCIVTFRQYLWLSMQGTFMRKIKSSTTAAMFGGTILAMILGNVAIAQSPLSTNDQRKERCLELTALGTGVSDKPIGSKVESAFHRFNLNILMDSVAVCRGAVGLFPNERRLATGAAHATKYFNLLLAGEKTRISRLENYLR